MGARIKQLFKLLFAALTATALVFGVNATAAFAATNTSSSTPTNSGVSHGTAKAAVCKYVGKPGVDERLQTGQNPIVVDAKSWMSVGSWFQDAQGRSVVIAILHPGDPAPSVSACPAPEGGPTQVAAVAPIVKGVCGPNDDSVALQTQPTGVVLKSDTGWVNNVRVVTYVATSGYTLSNSGVFTLTDNNTACPPTTTPVAAVAPIVKGVCGPNDDSVALQSQPAGVVLKSDTGWVNNVRTVTYVAAAGYTLTNSGVFTLTDNNTACPPALIPVTAVNGTFTDACGPVFNLQFTPTPTEGVTYVTMQMGNTLVVKAGVVDQSKYVLTNPNWEQQQTDSLTACPTTTVTAVAPIVKPVCGPNDDSVALQTQPAGVVLESDTGWKDNHRTLTYITLKGDVATTAGVFTLTDDNGACPPAPPVNTPPTTPPTTTTTTPPASTTVTTQVQTNASSTAAANQAQQTTSAEAVTGRGIGAQTAVDATPAAQGNPVAAVVAFLAVVLGGALVAFRRRIRLFRFVVRTPRHRA